MQVYVLAPDPISDRIPDRFWCVCCLRDRLEEKVGKTLEVLIDDIEGDMLIGRSYADAPDIDGIVQVYTDKEIKVGELINVEIEEAGESALIGSQV